MPSTAPRTSFIANFAHDPNYRTHFPHPIFEIIGIKSVEQDGGLVYRLNLSDGCHWIWGILVPNLHDMVDCGDIKVHTLIKLNAYYLETYKGKRFIAVEDLEVLSPQLSYASSEKHLEPSKSKGRIMLGDIGNLQNRMVGDYLVVVLGKRQDRKKNKHDYYLWDSSSPIIDGKLRKTILSVWKDLRNDFNPNPGTIVALRGMTKVNKFEEHPTEPLMIHTFNIGHLNAWASATPRGFPWFLIDPTQVEGYDELKRAWEEQQLVWAKRP